MGVSRPLSGCVLDHLLYQGSEVEVWCGRLEGDEGPVAVKRARDPDDPATGRRLRLEASQAGRVDHPGLLVPLGVVDDPPGVAIVYPYLPGGSVRDLLDRRGALTAGEIVALLEPVADALRARSDGGRAAGHGDLKPANLLLRADGSPVVADAGSTGWATPAYLDPAASAGGEPSPRRDVFALGVIAYEALTGRRPHRGEPAEVVALAAAGAHRDLGSWPGVPGGVAAVVESALAPDPACRPPTPMAFVAALRAEVDPAAIVLPGPAPTVRPLAVRRGEETIEFGPRPPAPDGAPMVRPVDRRWVGAAVASGALVVGASILGPTASPGSPPGGPPGRVRGAASDPCPPPGVTEATVGAEGTAGAEGTVAVDLDGDGCDEPASWDGEVLAALPEDGVAGPTRRLRIGGGRLQVRFGDWDGDGATTVAAYDPVAGIIRFLDRLDGPSDERTVRARRDGRSRVVRGEAGDRLTVDPG